MRFAERICVVGCSGSGKSTFARRCERELGHARLELDEVQHLRGWRERPEAEGRAIVREFVGRHERWVVDGNYAMFRELLWPAADTIVWLDLERAAVMRQIVARTARRVITREELWNGNRESWRHTLSRDPESSIVAWAWTRHGIYRRTYAEAARSTEHAHLRWLRLTDRHDVGLLFERARRLGGIAPDEDPARVGAS